MRTACLLAALCVVAVSGANLRQLPEPDPNYNETLGNDGGPDGLGVQPKMVPVGHFSLNKYAAKLGEMTQKGMKFRPLLVPPGHFSGVAPPEPSTPPVKPMMIPPGAFAAAAMAKRALESAQANGTLVEQQANVCKVMEKVLGLARFTYLIETEDSKKASDSKSVLSLVDTICPLLKRRYSSAMCHNSCDAMKANVERYFDAKYVGPVYANSASRCQGIGGQQVNFAVLYALSSARAMFNLTFCSAVSTNDCPEGTEPIPTYHKLKEQAKALRTPGSASDDDKQEEMVDVAKAEAEAKAMDKSSPPKDEIEEKAKAEADKYVYNALGQKCCKACGGCAKCVQCSIGTVVVPNNPSGGDDTYNNNNMHNVVTDQEAMGVNKPRGPTTFKAVASAMAQ